MIFQHSSLTCYMPLVKDENSFYEIRSLAIYANITKVLNRVLNGFWKHVWSIWKIILLLTEDDSALKAAQLVTFRGLVAHKPVAYKNEAWQKNHFIKGDELSTECTQLVEMLWRWIWGDQISTLKATNWSLWWEPSFTHPPNSVHLTLSLGRIDMWLTSNWFFFISDLLIGLKAIPLYRLFTLSYGKTLYKCHMLTKSSS